MQSTANRIALAEAVRGHWGRIGMLSPLTRREWWSRCWSIVYRKAKTVRSTICQSFANMLP